MPDLTWPADLMPYRVAFYLQPHVGGQESPLTRTRKVYGLSAPRWIARLTFRGGYAGAPRLGQHAGYGPRLDALIAEMEGGLNRIRFHDFRRPLPLQPRRLAASEPLRARAAAKGASQMVIDGFAPNSIAFSVGDYVGGDGRPHLIQGGSNMAGVGSIRADATGAATVRFRPPLSQDVVAGTALAFPVTGRFQLNGEDGGQNETEVGGLTEYVLDFIEDLGT